MIDELAAVVGMEVQQHEGELGQSYISEAWLMPVLLAIHVTPTTCHWVTSSTALM